MLRRLTLVRTGVSKEHIASIIRMTRIGGLGTALAIASHVVLVRTDYSEERTAYITRVIKIGELGTTLA
jgi:hypothetical protein